MSFWKKVGKVVEAAIENGPAIIEAMQQEGAKRQASFQKEAEKKINNYEKKVNQASRSNRMSDPEFARKVREERGKISKAKVKLYTEGVESNSVKTSPTGEVLFAGQTISQWDGKWIRLGTLSSLTLEHLTPYNKHIGLYKAEMNGKVAYLGKAVEYSNGGFRKRLRDYVRGSDSARTHGSGKKMNEHVNSLTISILLVGNSAEDVETVVALEKAMIGRYEPGWNVQHNR
jgi:hypothetical protein